MDKGNPVIVSVIYHPPNLNKHTKEGTINHIISNISKFCSTHNSAKFLICGDFNDLDTSSIVQLFPFTQMVHFPTRDAKMLDLVFTDIGEYAGGCERLDPISTNDHCAISLTPSAYVDTKRYKTVCRREISSKSKVALTDELRTADWSFVSGDSSVHDKVSKFQDYIMSLYNKHCPLRNIRVPVDKPLITSPLIRKLKRAKQRAHKGNKSSWKALSRVLIFHQQRELKSLTDNEINSVSRGTKNWWSKVKRVTGDNINLPNSSPVVSIDDRWISSSDFADQFNNYLVDTDVLLEYPSYAVNDSPGEIEEYIVHYHLENIDTTKSTISEDYPSWITKNNAHILSEPITLIINDIFKSGQFPNLWKRAEVIPANKKSNPETFKDYRPISLLYHLSKIVERIISNRIQEKIPSTPNQYAYTRQIGTTDALVKFSSDVCHYLDDKNVLLVQSVMLDFSKAFDRMRPDLTISKLIGLKVDTYLVRLIQDFFTNRQHCVKFKGCMSSFKDINVGVPQGTVLGPILWNLFISDFSPSVDHVKYADDITLYYPTKKGDCEVHDSTAHHANISYPGMNHLQQALDYTSNYCKENHLIINVKKSTTLNFTLQKSIRIPPLCIADGNLSHQPEVKLLGVIFNQHHRFDSHIDAVIEKTKSATHAMIKLKRSGVNPSSLALFYRARILSVLSYSAPCWYPHVSDNGKNKLERYQKYCTRLIIHDEEDYDNRLSILKLSELNIHLQILCFHFVSKVQFNEDHPCHKYLTRQQSFNRTTLLDNNVFHKFV